MSYYAYAIFHRSCNDEAIASSCLKVATASSVCVFVCLLDTTVSRTKTAEPIEVPFGVRTANSGRPIGARNYVLRGGGGPRFPLRHGELVRLVSYLVMCRAGVIGR